MATCGRCGATRLDDSAAFCGSCGAPLAHAGEPREPADAEGAAIGGEHPGSLPDAEPATRPEPAARVLQLADSRSTIPEVPLSVALASASLRSAEAASAKPPLAPLAGAPRSKVVAKPSHLPAGSLIDKKYAVLRVLGEGGMGVVYLARDIHTGLDVVVKAVRAELAHRDDVRARTLAEGRALAQIDHPNVVHLRAVAVDGPHLYLVMQYIDGESLDKIIARNEAQHEPMRIEEALAVFRQVASGVGAAHEEGVIHRDLKPANVLLRTKDKVAKVTDFGIALVPSDASRPETRGVLGSLWYMSPEQVTGRRDLDRRVDVYALGIMLYQMLVGRVPFDAKSDYEIMRLQAEAPMPRAADARPDVPPAVDELIQKACAKDREQRFARCEELIAAVDRILGYAPPTMPGHTGLVTPTPTIAATTFGLSVPGAASADPPGGAPNVASSAVAIEDTPLPEPRRGRVWLALVALLVACAAASIALGFVPGVPGLVKIAPAAGKQDAGAPKPPADDAGAARTGIEALAGAWIGNGRELDAVMVGGDLEFRIKKPEQFAPQNYDTGEPRFVLRATAEPGVFAVEDRIRPVPPKGKTYDPRARGTCQEVWSSVGGEALRARFDGSRLSVEFAKIEPLAANFTSDGNRVTSCVGLRDLKPSKVVSVLTRL